MSPSQTTYLTTKGFRTRPEAWAASVLRLWFLQAISLQKDPELPQETAESRSRAGNELKASGTSSLTRRRRSHEDPGGSSEGHRSRGRGFHGDRSTLPTKRNDFYNVVNISNMFQKSQSSLQLEKTHSSPPPHTQNPKPQW